MSGIIGKWVQDEGQPYEGLWFKFNDDGTFEAQYEPMGIVSSGTYKADGEAITIQQTSHTLVMVGEFEGLFKLKEGKFLMALASAPGGTRPDDLVDARVYIKE